MTDQEILAQISDSRDKVRTELRAELEELFKKEKDNLLERAQLFMNVSKWTAASMAVVFGLLGIKAWSDVRSNVEGYFQTKLEKLYRIDEAGSPLARSIDQLLDRAVVNALYTEIQRSRAAGKDGARRTAERRELPKLTSGEQDRLVKRIKSSTTETLEFEDTIYVLNELVTEEDKRQAVSSTLAELLAAARKSESAWMSDNEKKRLAILLNFRDSEAVDAAASELLSQPVSDRLRTAVFVRIRKENFKGAVPQVLKFIDTTEDQTSKFQAYLTLAGLRPDHETVKTFVLNDLANRVEKIDILHCFEMAAALASDKKDSFFLDSDERARHKRLIALLAVPLAAKAIDSGVRLRYSDFGAQGLMAQIRVAERSYRSTKIGREVFSAPFIDELLNLALKKPAHALANYLEALSVQSERGLVNAKIYATLTPDSVVDFEDGTRLVLSDVGESKIQLRSSGTKEGTNSMIADDNKDRSRGDSTKVIAIWKNLAGSRFERNVKLIRNIHFEAEYAVSRGQIDQEPENF